MSYRQLIAALAGNANFRQWFNSILADAPLESYRLETPALSMQTLDNKFEFVLINAVGLLSRSTDSLTFNHYFQQTDELVVEFKSLGGDATLIAPVPHAGHEIYNHLAVFARNAPESQIDALWQMAGDVMNRDTGTQPLWFNTEGGGVAWLHVRVDTRPKYYGYAKYTVVNDESLMDSTS